MHNPPKPTPMSDADFLICLELLAWHVCLDCAVELRALPRRPDRLPPAGDGSRCAMCGHQYPPRVSL